MNPEKLAAALHALQNNPYTRAELLSYHQNVLDRNGPQELLEAIEDRLRRDYPAAANAAFGRKSDEATEMLARIIDRLGAEFDLSGNKVKPHVKVGGYEQSGEHYICRYISYKNDADPGVQLTLSQLTADSELRAIVGSYRTNAKKENFRNEDEFALGELDQALALYRKYLIELGARPVQ